MYKIGDFLVYRKDVCQVVGVKEKFSNNTDYLEVIPLTDESLNLKVPVDSSDIRNLLSKEEVLVLIDKIKDIKPIDITQENEKYLANEYKNMVRNGNHEDLVKIIKTTYLRNQNRLKQNKKIGDKDNEYFLLAEKLLYTEIAVVLDMSVDDAKDYVLNRVHNMK